VLVCCKIVLFLLVESNRAAFLGAGRLGCNRKHKMVYYH
jgi:hypothetical protein